MESKFTKKSEEPEAKAESVELCENAEEMRDESLADEKIIEQDSSNVSADSVMNKTRANFTYGDPTVPKGWGIRLRSNGSKKGVKQPPRKNFCDPNGLIFLTRREAYEYMRDNQEYSEADLELMRKNMMSAPMRAAQIKREREKDAEINKPEVNSVVLEGQDNTEKEKDRELIKPKINSIVLEGYDYKDSSVPKGWGLKTVPNGKWNRRFICSPEGKVFTKRKEAYEYMLACATIAEAGTYSTEV